MRPLFHPSLVNGRYGDPAVYVDTMFENRSLLFDLGDITVLPPRKIHRIERIFISHTHIDHFIGFDYLLRLLVGREKTVHLYGPKGLGEAVHHKLQGYRWDLVESYACDLAFEVSELTPSQSIATTRFRLKTAFAPEPLGERPTANGLLCTEPRFQVSAAILEHHTSCLGFALEEAAHVNIWKNRLAERGLPVGPWLQGLKQAVAEGLGDDHLIRIDGAGAEPRSRELGDLRDLLTVTAGQKIGYVTDVADTADNRAAIIALVRNADVLFIEAAFAAADAALARQRAHLTTKAAGDIARTANARRVEPFHFSPRYAEEEQRMLDEVMGAFKEAASVIGAARGEPK
ncbi:MAG TPA: MBL fold metallo-hydrolase [Bradyrhizobium sp.]|nr:MBL fold metallo-hydrolase [Bradyrhizobium sp.]